MKSNLRDPKTLADLDKAFEKKDTILEPDAIEFGRERIGEEEIIRDEIRRIQNQLRLSTRNMALPGLRANINNIIGAVVKFKDDVYEGNIRPVYLAKHDDVTLELCKVLNVNGMTKKSISSWAQSAVTAGTAYGIFPPGATADTAACSATLDDEEWLFFTGDIIDFDSDAAFECIEYEYVDGEQDYKPESILLSQKGSDIQLGLISAMLVKSRVLESARCTTTGSAELMPVAIHITRGSNVEGLT